jgi:hypothetical protein
VNKRLRELATNLKAFGTSGNGTEPKKTGNNDEQPEKDNPQEPPA